MSGFPGGEKTSGDFSGKLMWKPSGCAGLLTGNQLGKITVIEGVDPNARLMTGGGAKMRMKRSISCVATVRKSDLVK